jgi:hypothetical protein
MVAHASGRIVRVSGLPPDAMTMTALARTEPDPTPAVLALDAEREHDDARVRRRVAQGLAAIAVSHPTLALATAQRWLAEGGEHTLSVVRRGLRPLIEARDATALRLAGFAPETAARVRRLTLDTATVALGEHVRFSCRVVSAETRPAAVLVEYTVARLVDTSEVPVAHGRLACRTLGPLTDAELSRAHRLPGRPSARWQPGPHVVYVSVNGRRDATAKFTVTD